MTRFLQIHMLTSYPPSNLNRDDLGRPKTAVMGGVTRLRVSSQSLKRAWRKSEIFENAVKKDHIGTRTKEMGMDVYKSLMASGVEEEQAREWAGAIAGEFGKPKRVTKKEPFGDLFIEQLAHFTPEERAAIDRLVENMIETKQGPTDEDLALLQKEHTAADVALFGRMLAAAPAFNTEAAAQVAHAITVHKVAVEDDFFTAVDDLNIGEEDMGAGHMGETEFGAGLFYLYMCIDCESLVGNLMGNQELAGTALTSLVEAAAKVAPTGKQNSFASRAYASYILAEAGSQQPRSLSVAFLKAARGEDLLSGAIDKLEETRKQIDSAYGSCADKTEKMNVVSGVGTLDNILGFVKECVS